MFYTNSVNDLSFDVGHDTMYTNIIPFIFVYNC